MLRVIVVSLVLVMSSCLEDEPKLSPRVMKDVKRGFRKSKKDLKLEMDSLCVIYKEENIQRLIDSTLEIRLKEDESRRLIIK